IGLAFTHALQLLAARSRLLVALDDVQWLDAASATVLAYALRRLQHPGAVLLAQRPEQPDVLAIGRLDRAAVVKVELGPLSIGAIGRILHVELVVAYTRPALHRLA